MNSEQDLEQLVEAWVVASSIFKKSKMTEGLTYNESIVMFLMYKKYQQGMKAVSIKEIQMYTRMTKSLLNRTMNALIKKELIRKMQAGDDARIAYIELVEERLEVFLEVHRASIKKAEKIIQVIGLDHAKSFIQSMHKIQKYVD